MTGARRTALFVAIVCTAVALAGGYLLRALQRPAIAQAPGLSAASIAVSLPPPGAPFFLFRWTRQGPSYGVLAYTDPDRTAPPVPISNLRCQRVHMAGGRGVCLAARGGTAFRARLFDDRFKVFAELPLPGVPSRTQVAPDGKLAATTVFVSGHSYTDAGFSTQTGIVDLTRGAWLIENLESFTVHRRGAIVRSIDFNFWGVTFMRDGRTFVATLGTKSERLLVRGNVDTRQVEVIEEKVECPSLSPDNRRVAFKQRLAGQAFGRMGDLVWISRAASVTGWPRRTTSTINCSGSATPSCCMPGHRPRTLRPPINGPSRPMGPANLHDIWRMPTPVRSSSRQVGRRKTKARWSGLRA